MFTVQYNDNGSAIVNNLVFPFKGRLNFNNIQTLPEKVAFVKLVQAISPELAPFENVAIDDEHLLSFVIFENSKTKTTEKTLVLQRYNTEELDLLNAFNNIVV